ncbi:MAG: dihydroorotase [Candidatus Omnitrophica bacterium]|nr:dihydroorotase [Candidatus Omnitrophota bacterium]
MDILIKNGHLIDPETGTGRTADLFIKDGVIAHVGEGGPSSAAKVMDASGKLVLPGLVDMHVHLREPGREDKETMATGTRAAVKGGVTSVLAMPNTTPAADSPQQVRHLLETARKTACAHVFAAGAITKGRAGVELTDFQALKAEGVVAVTDDGSSVDDDDVMLEAFRQAGKCGMLVICHCEDRRISGKGVMNLGFMSTVLGLRGIPREAEIRRLERDLELAAKAGCRVHIAHVSCSESVALIAAAKKRGMPVTAETAPHYLALTEEALESYDANFKMNPPLRSPQDREALCQAVQNGVIDAIASDHAPHTESEKDIEFDHAEFGVTGLETELGVIATEFVASGRMSWTDLARLLSFSPAKILGINRGTLKIGQPADVVLIDPQKEWIVTKRGFASKSSNSSFIGRKLKGAVISTVCAGKIVYSARNGVSGGVHANESASK